MISTLPNGMTVIIQEQHSAPIVAIQVWVHVGSKDETDATRGLAHIQEHMLFQGTKNYGPGTIFKTIQAAGGDLNAFTDYDETVYHVTLPAEKLDTGLQILSSMMHEATIDSDALAKELEVVMEEFRGDTQNPSRMLDEAVTATAFQNHPYKFPVIGFKDTIENITVDQVRSFYDNWYVPQNMTLVIVGDIDQAAIQKQISQTFGSIPTRANPKRDIPLEPAQKSSRSVVLKAPFENTLLSVAFRAPSYSDEDAPAVDALMSILGLGKSSRLVQNVQERDHLVTGIGAGFVALEQPYLAGIEANIKPEDSTRALTGILRELKRLREEPVTEQELSRVKAQLEAALLFKRQSFDGTAENLGFQQLIGGGVGQEQRYRNGIQSLTTAQLLEVANRYLVPGRMTVGFLYPEAERKTLSESRISGIVRRVLGPSTLARVTSSQTSVADRTFDAKTGVTKVRLKNGLTLLIREESSTPTFAAEAFMLGGVRSETVKTNGISTLLSQMLLRGTKSMNQSQIATRLDTMAATIRPFSDRNSFGLSLNSLSKYSHESISLLGELLQKSHYPSDQVKQVASLLQAGIDRKKDNPFLLSFQQLNRALYGTHPYALPQDGSAEVLGKLQQKDLQAFAAEMIVPENIVLSVVGDIKTDDMIQLVSTTFGSMQTKAFAKTPLPAPLFSTTQNVVKMAGKEEQTHIFLGFPTFDLSHEDRYALAVTDSILGSTAGRLFSTLRDKESLAYSVQGFIISGLDTPGFYGVYIGSEPEKTDKAIAGLEREIRKVADDGVSDQEVKDAISNITGSYVVGLQTPESQAHLLAVSERFGLGYDDYLHFVERIQAVTKEDVQRIAKTYFDLQKSTLSVVGGE